MAVVKLNGGLGTSMGCVGPKSVIEVRQNKTFLDILINQIQNLNDDYDADVPLVLMNSFNTHEDTKQILDRNAYSGVTIKAFNQSRYPRIYKESLTPLAESFDSDNECWYPPGHGDFFVSIYNSGILDELQKEGKEYIFLSNVDNLCATVNLNILAHMIEKDSEYIMEVTNKTLSDVKGGTLIKYEDKIKLLEIAQVPKEHVQEFKSIKKFKIFNTNNLWIKIDAIKRVIESNEIENVDIIPNEKHVSGQKVLQLETAAGAAISLFNNAKAVNVPRSRFLPVKDTSDLFMVQSGLFELRHGSLSMSSSRPFPARPIVKLGPCFKNVNDFSERVGGGIDILELDRLTISGDVTIGRNVTLRGSVIIIANDGEKIEIPEGAVLENKIVTGNLRIVDL